MVQDSVIITKRHQRFVTTVCSTKTVYALKNKRGFATSSSTKFEDEQGNAIGIICFWAEKAVAKSCIKKEWSSYKLIEISLADFIENWCIGMENDNLLVGTEFDQNMFGFEAEPLELILELSAELKTQGANVNLRNFDGINDLEKQVRAVLE